MDDLIAADEIGTIAVLGAGTMGSGIAQVAAAAGMRVGLRDVDDRAVERGLGLIRAVLDKGVALAKVTAEARDATLARISTAVDLAAAVATADAVIEAVPED